MSYCKWMTSKRFLQSLPSVCCVQHGATITALRSYSRIAIVPLNLKNASPTSKLHNQAIDQYYTSLKNGSHNTRTGLLSNLPATFWADVRHIHNYRSNNDDRLRRRGKQEIELNEEDPFCIDGDTFGHPTIAPAVKNQKKSSLKSNQHFSTFNESPQDAYEVEDIFDKSHNLSHKDHDRIINIFPTPKVTLHNLEMMLGKKFCDTVHKQSTSLQSSKGKVKTRFGPWTSTCSLTWPHVIQFEAVGLTKQLSSNKVAVKALHWLYSQKKIDDKGRPIYNKEVLDEMKKELNRPLVVKIDDAEVTKINHLLATYKSKIEPLLTVAHERLHNKKSTLDTLPASFSTNEVDEEVDEIDMDSKNVHSLSLSSQMEFRDMIFGISPEEKDPEMMMRRNELLFSRWQNAKPEVNLPITQSKEKILSTIAANRAVVIRGAPGCGKSTRTPSYLLDAACEAGKGAECCILVSQPRRVAALALAHRVASERDEEVGDVIGHQVRLSTTLPKPPGGAILYCTAGALLRRLASSPGLPGCSHLVLDEAHERSADSDAVMALAKRAMFLNPKLKVIVMSATLDTQLFSRYFDDCPIIDIPGFTFPVTSHFLEDFAPSLNMIKTLENCRREDGKAGVNADEVTEIIKWVDRTKPEGAILCFLPGWQDIKKVRDNLDYQLRKKGGHIILPVHSRLSNEDQRKIFNTPPPGVRKIILATNIAETSITINDVSYVIDSGVHKEHRLMDKKGISSLDNDWISKASAAQRRGRAGRVKPGECFHLYTRQKMESFLENPIPEILRVPLEKTVMDCKTYSVNDSALEFLSQFPQPPSPEAIAVAVKDLIQMGALDEKEQLTALGRRIAPFTTHPKISKALVHSTIFKVASPVIDLSTILSNNIDLFSCGLNEIQDVRNLKEEYHPTSDHMALYWLTQKYQEIRAQKGYKIADNFCRRARIRIERMKSVYDLRKICVEHLQQCRMLPQFINDKNAMFKEEDKFSNVDELVKGVLLSGLNTLLNVKYTLKTKGKLSKITEIVSDQGQHAFISSSSVNHNLQKRFDEGALLYCGAVHSKERRGLLVRDTSLLQPITVFLFSQKLKKVYQNEETTVFAIDDKRVRLQCTPEQGDLLMEFHTMIWTTVQYYIENKGFLGEREELSSFADDEEEDLYQSNTPNGSGNKTIDNFKDKLVRTVAMILNEAEVALDKESSSSITENELDDYER